MTNITSQIKDLLKTSSVNDDIKAHILENLEDSDQKSLKKILKILISESKKMMKLKRKEERVIEKYGQMMSRVVKK